MRFHSPRQKAAFLLSGGLLVVLAASAAGGEIRAEPEAADPLTERGYAVSGGAAPGYVDDRICGSCHRELYRSYREVGMARSFYRLRPSNLVEDFESKGFYHEPSSRHYRMERRGDRLVMKRHQIAADGEPIHAVEQEVDWVLGGLRQPLPDLPLPHPGGRALPAAHRLVQPD